MTLLLRGAGRPSDATGGGGDPPGAFPTVRGVADGISNGYDEYAGVTIHQADFDVPPQEGDTVLAIVTAGSTSGWATAFVGSSVAAGFDPYSSGAVLSEWNGASMQIGIFLRTVGASEGDYYFNAFDWQTLIVQCFVIKDTVGWDTTSPDYDNADQPVDMTLGCLSLETLGPNRLVFFIWGAHWGNSQGTAVWTLPVGITPLLDTANADGSLYTTSDPIHTQVAVGTKVLTSAGDTGLQTATMDASGMSEDRCRLFCGRCIRACLMCSGVGVVRP